MSVSREPKPRFGFVYVLTNPSMPNLFKVGFTTNSISQRIHELSSTTGVPRRFVAERLFEIEERFLRLVERRAHQTLHAKGVHHGKEFFQGQLRIGIEAVEDAIYAITGTSAHDLVGEAQRRAEKLAYEQECERQRAYEAMQKQERHAEEVRAEDDKIRQIRERQLTEEWDSTNHIESSHLLLAMVWLVLFLIWGAYGFEAVWGFFLLLTGVGGYLTFAHDKSESRRRLKADIERRFPLKSADNVQSSAPRETSSQEQRSTAIMRCVSCGQRLKVPVGRRIRVKCPRCRAEWTDEF